MMIPTTNKPQKWKNPPRSFDPDRASSWAPPWHRQRCRRLAFSHSPHTGFVYSLHTPGPARGPPSNIEHSLLSLTFHFPFIIFYFFTYNIVIGKFVHPPTPTIYNIM